MTVPSATLPRMDYTGNGSLTVYPYAFPIFSSADLTVYVGGVLQALTTQYTVSGAGTPGGGNVTFVTAPGAVAVSILRSVQAVQGTDLRENDPQPAETLEAGLDRPIMLIQQTQETLGRAPQFSPFSVYKNALLDDPIVGNVLRAKSLSPVEFEWASVVSGSLTLPLPVNQGGTGGTDAASARVGLGVDGHIRKVLTNKTGSTLAAGNVVAIDSANDSAVKLGDTVGGLFKYVVAAATIASNATGDFITAGVIQAGSTGAIARGQYVRKSATSLVVEDSGTAVGVATAAPAGALGIALAAAAGGFVTILLFDQPYTAGLVTVTGSYEVRGNVSKNNAATPTTKFDLLADLVQCWNPTDNSILVKKSPGTLTVDFGLAGPAALGRDVAGAFGASQWLYPYWIMKADGTISGTVSANAPVTGPVLPATYVAWAPANAVRWNASSNIVPCWMAGNWTWYVTRQSTPLTTGTAIIETAVSLGTVVPPGALSASLLHKYQNTGAAGSSTTLRHTAGADFFVQQSGGGDAVMSTPITVPNNAQQVFYQNSSGAATGTTLWALGYEMAAGGD